MKQWQPRNLIGEESVGPAVFGRLEVLSVKLERLEQCVQVAHASETYHAPSGKPSCRLR
jgi:hypothetical protein